MAKVGLKYLNEWTTTELGLQDQLLMKLPTRKGVKKIPHTGDKASLDQGG